MILVDINVFLDVARQRAKWPSSYSILMKARISPKFCISALSIVIIHFKLFNFHTTKAKKELEELTKGFEIIPLTVEILNQSLSCDHFIDFEDAIQFYSALATGCDTIITRNATDFSKVIDKIRVLTPEEFIDIHGVGV